MTRRTKMRRLLTAGREPLDDPSRIRRDYPPVSVHADHTAVDVLVITSVMIEISEYTCMYKL
jgi:hypothetical protein